MSGKSKSIAVLAVAGKAGLLGCSNTLTWRIERARTIARVAGRPGYSCVQQRYSYLQPLPEHRQSDIVTEGLLDYADAENLAVLAYSPLLAGYYANPDRPLPAGYAHPGSQARLAVLQEVAGELGATPGQVVLAWLLAESQPSVIPIPGASSVAQLEEIIGATKLAIDEETIRRLDQAGRIAPGMAAV